MVVHHTSIWRFTDILKDEQQSNQQVSTQALSSHTQIQPPTTQYQQNQIRITEIVYTYNEYKTSNQSIYTERLLNDLRVTLTNFMMRMNKNKCETQNSA